MQPSLHGDAKVAKALRELPAERLLFEPSRDTTGPCYRLKAVFALGRVFAGIIRSQGWYVPSGIRHLWNAADAHYSSGLTTRLPQRPVPS